VASVLVAFAFCNPVFAQDAPATQAAKDLYYLSSDQLEGRGVGTKGLELAGDYIAARFKSIGLKTLPGCDDYFQPFTMNANASVSPSTRLVINNIPASVKDFRPLGVSTDGEFAAPVVFVGYGVANGTANYDDYAGVDVKGKVVLMMRYEPHNESGTSRFTRGDWSPAATFTAKAANAASHGAAAILLVNPPRHHDPDQLMPISAIGGKSTIPFVQVTQDYVNSLLKTAGVTKNIGALQAEIDGSGKPSSFELKGITASATVAIERKKVTVRNVLAMLPGTSNSGEFVVIGAHYDHLGRGGPGSLAPSADEIHNGADDNASGTTTVMALAEKMAAAGPRERSVIFILFAGEEQGLLGSDHFVDHPPIPLDKIAAMLNLDMVGRVRNEVLYHGGSGTAGSFDTILAAADKASPLELKSMGKGGLGPSDHQSFSTHKIPVLFFFSGMHADYHRPTDDADKVNYQGIAEVTDLSFDVVKALSAMPRQQYAATFDSQPLVLGGTGSRGSRVTLGVVPDYGSDESTKGVKISGTSPKSPAEQAGLKEGDVIVQMNEKKIDNLVDLTEFLNGAAVGDRVTVGVERGGEHLQLETKLAERRAQ
jgi:Zn-dependent M28 family amino/carboxypeptidase